MSKNSIVTYLNRCNMFKIRRTAKMRVSVRLFKKTYYIFLIKHIKIIIIRFGVIYPTGLVFYGNKAGKLL